MSSSAEFKVVTSHSFDPSRFELRVVAATELKKLKLAALPAASAKLFAKQRDRVLKEADEEFRSASLDLRFSEGGALRVVVLAPGQTTYFVHEALRKEAASFLEQA